jgi:hypothetical protein
MRLLAFLSRGDKPEGFPLVSFLGVCGSPFAFLVTVFC